MNVTDYTYLINKPDVITEKQAEALGNVLIEFPYFQSARALRLKGLYNQNSFKYNYALKVAAAHTADRSVLFDFITSDTFTSIQNEFYDKKLRELLNITVFDSQVVSPDEIKKSIEVRINPIEESIYNSIKQATSTVFEKPVETEEKTIEPVIEESVEAPVEETRPIVFEEVLKEKQDDTIKEDLITPIEETKSVIFEELKTQSEPTNIIKEETISIPIKETRPTFFEEVVEIEEETFDPVIVKSVSTSIEEITPIIVENEKVSEIRIDPIEESIYNSIREATTVIFEESKPAKEEAVEEPKSIIEEQSKEVVSVVFEELKITEGESNDVTPIVLEQTKTIEENPKEVITFILEEPAFIEEFKEVGTIVSEEIKITEEEEPVEAAAVIIEESKAIEEESKENSLQETIKIAEENLEIGKPLDFSVSEKHSFQEWLQLAKPEPIDRTNEFIEENIVEENIKVLKKTPEPITKTIAETETVEEEKKKKAKLIDKFIETNPKISPIKATVITLPPIQFDINQEDNSYLMTETLARVYLEQKKYTKAIQAYEILILKYPEKISFFADRISDIKILQQNNNNN